MVVTNEVTVKPLETEDFDVQCAVGLADCCELMSTAFSFPNEDFARSLIDGSFAFDTTNCLKDATKHDCGDEVREAVSKVCESIAAFAGQNEFDLLDRLRKGYSILFLAPGGETPVWPYEAAFRHTEAGRTDTPILFRAQITIDVERHMQKAGVQPKNRLKEPSDSIWNEFSFLSYLYGSTASALCENRAEDASLWHARTQEFWKEHGNMWLHSFMNRVKVQATECSYGAEYAIFAQLGTCVLDLIAQQ